MILIPTHTLEIILKQITRIERSAFGFGMELRAENGPRIVDHAFVAGVVQIDEVFFPVGGESRSVDGVAMVLARDVAAPGREV